MTHTPLEPFAAVAGPRNPRILLIGEAWGESEAAVRQPFAGESGKELWRMLGEAWPDLAPQEHALASELHKAGPSWVTRREPWLRSASLAYTNVFALRPPGNKLDELCANVKEVRALSPGYDWPHIAQGKYIRPEFLGEIDRLEAEIESFNPNLIVAAGNAACWAVLRETNIGSIRGTIRVSRPIRNRQYKVLPTYHPAAVLRQWNWRVIVIADLMKARIEGESPEFSRPSRSILYSPSLAQIQTWADETLAMRPPVLACDTETFRGQVTMISFARAPDDAIVIPFVDQFARERKWNFWAEPWQEERALESANSLLASSIVKVFQNGMYDFQYLRRMGCNLHACTEDTMLLHHSILPEMKKGLGFLGSIYTREPAWKLMRLQKADTEKRDE